MELSGLPAGIAQLAAALLDDAAVQGGGRRRSQPGVEELLGGSPGAAARARAAVAQLLGAAARAATGTTGEEPPPGGGAAARDEWARRLPAGRLLRRSVLARRDRPALQRLAPNLPASADPALRDLLCRRLLAALADPTEAPALPQLKPGLGLALDLPLLAPPPAPLAAGGVAVLPLLAAAAPAALARRAGALRAAGWAAALLLPGAEALSLLDASRLPVDLLLVQDPGEGLPERLPLSPPLALAGRIGPALRARAEAEGWLVEGVEG